jgi:membrane protease YdiL (CAAX protease family)
VEQSDLTFPRLEDRPPQRERPSPIPGVTWGWRDLVLGIFAALLAFVILGAAILGTTSALFDDDSIEVDLSEVAAIAMLDTVLVLTVLAVISRKGAGLWNLGFRAPRQGWGVMIGFIVAAYVGAIILVNLYGVAINLFGLDELEPSQQLPDDFYDRTLVVALTGFTIIFMAPIAEEIFFRGFIFAGLRRYINFGGLLRYLNLPIAGLISGFLFSLAHGDPGLIVPFAGVGLILAILYEKTGSLWTSIGVHFVFNTLSFSLLLLFPELR